MGALLWHTWRYLHVDEVEIPTNVFRHRIQVILVITRQFGNRLNPSGGILAWLFLFSKIKKPA